MSFGGFGSSGTSPFTHFSVCGKASSSLLRALLDFFVRNTDDNSTIFLTYVLF